MFVKRSSSPVEGAASSSAPEAKKSYNKEEIIRKLYASKTKVWVSHAEWPEAKLYGMNEIIDKARQEGSNLIFHLTPGPALDMKNDLTESENKEWNGEKKCDLFGCTATLQAFESAYASVPKTIVFNINIQPHAKQCGKDKILDKRNLNHIYGISDPELKLINEVGFPTIEVGDDKKKFAARLTAALKPSEETGDVFEVRRGQDGVNTKSAEAHIAEVQTFLSMEPKKAAGMSLTQAAAET